MHVDAYCPRAGDGGEEGERHVWIRAELPADLYELFMAAGGGCPCGGRVQVRALSPVGRRLPDRVLPSARGGR